MIEKLKLVRDNSNINQPLMIHPEILDILFEYRRYIRNLYLQIHGFFEIDHFGLNIINPNNQIVSFSSTPNIEYNLVKQDLWRDDPCFTAHLYENNEMILWDDALQHVDAQREIRKIKLENNKYCIGMTIPRKVNGFCFLYSYASKSVRSDLSQYLQSNLLGLINIGDYFSKSVLEIYSEFYTGQIPKINELSSAIKEKNVHNSLRLIVNNT